MAITDVGSKARKLAFLTRTLLRTSGLYSGLAMLLTTADWLNQFGTYEFIESHTFSQQREPFLKC